MVFYLDRVSSICSSTWPGTRYVDQVSLELTEIHLPQPPLSWNFNSGL